MNKQKPKVLVIVGATASGKTGLGIKLAKSFSGEIISADSMQIYKGLDIGTAKVSKEEMDETVHHFIDILEIGENFSVASYKDMCYKKIDEILSKNKLPIIVGGTGLYINSVVNNMKFDKVNSDNNFDGKYRKKLEDILLKDGKEKIYNLLIKKDPKAAENIHINNSKRVIRALEIINKYGLKSDIDSREDLWIPNPSPYDFFIIYLKPPREEIYGRINNRVELMTKKGIIEEAKMLYDLKLDTNSTCMSAIGYKEWFGYIEGTSSKEECKNVLKQATRRYAKRQITWFNKLGNNYIINSSDILDIDIQKLKGEIFK